jgi:hypothetical protein
MTSQTPCLARSAHGTAGGVRLHYKQLRGLHAARHFRCAAWNRGLPRAGTGWQSCTHMRTALAILVLTAGIVGARLALAREPGEPIRLTWSEGDVAGMSTIWAPNGVEPIGFVEYHQTRHGDRLSSIRVARFRDGSSDEDSADARVGETLESLSGRSIIRDRDGTTIVDLEIDVEKGRIVATWGRGTDERTLTRDVELPPGTYWGPLIFILLKNFDANAENGRLAFRTIAPTPKPFVLDMALSRGEPAVVERMGIRLQTETYRLNPSIHWTVDPVVRMFAPSATFFMLPGDPPALARFTGPRNYARQEIVIQ